MIRRFLRRWLGLPVEVHVYIDPLDPDDAAYQRAVQRAVRRSVDRWRP